MKKNVLILGGAGFIGSHLAEAIVAEGHFVGVVDTLKYCYPDNIERLKGEKWTPETFRTDSFQLFQGDVANPHWQIPRVCRWDEIYMLAGVVCTADFLAKPIEAFHVSIAQVDNVMRYVFNRMMQDVKVLFASSSEVYGNPHEIPTPEEDLGQVDQLGERSGYDEGKRGAEAL